MIQNLPRSYKKFFFICSSLPDDSTGGLIVKLKILKYLEKKGLKIEYIALLGDNNRTAKWKVIKTNLRLIFKYSRFRDSMILETGYDAPWLLFFNLYARIRGKCKIVTFMDHLRYHEMTSTPMVLIHKIVEWIYFRTPHLTITDGYHPYNDLIALGIREKRLAMVQSTVNVLGNALQCRKKKTGETIRLLYVGNLVPRKGLEYLIEAVSIADSSNIILDLVGNNQDRPDYFLRIERLINELKLEQVVNIWGRVSWEELNRLYEISDIFVFPSLYEGLGLVIDEAMGYGLPIVATGIGGIPTLVRDGFNGLLVPPADSKALALAITRILQDDDLRLRLSQNSIAVARTFRTWDEVGEDYLSELMVLD